MRTWTIWLLANCGLLGLYPRDGPNSYVRGLGGHEYGSTHQTVMVNSKISSTVGIPKLNPAISHLLLVSF